MLVDIRDLCTWFRLGRDRTVHAVDKVSLQIAERQTVGLVGESGSGKTTLGKTLAGLLEKTSGEIYYRGEKLPDRYSAADFRRYSGEIQMIFQDPYASLNPRMTVAEIIAEPLRLQRGNGKNHRDAVAHWLRQVGLQPEHMSRYPHEFSGGQRQRIGIARALITEPRFVICDEPISALDVSVQAQVVNLLQDLQQQLGLTLLFIAHDLSMVRYISDRMAVMYLGAVVEEGPAEAVYSAPLHPYTRLLVASNPEPDPRRERERSHEPIKGEIPSPVNIQPGCRFAGRCPDAMPHCRDQTPELREHQPGHFVACHLYE
jgi:oligopeptide/dipeptide ABC transporter ATP-binding protein